MQLTSKGKRLLQDHIDQENYHAEISRNLAVLSKRVQTKYGKYKFPNFKILRLEFLWEDQDPQAVVHIVYKDFSNYWADLIKEFAAWNLYSELDAENIELAERGAREALKEVLFHCWEKQNGLSKD